MVNLLMLLVACPSEGVSKRAEIAWIVNRAKRNISRGVQTCIISTYNSIPMEDLSDVLADKRILYVNIIHDARSGLVAERIFEINDQVLDIGVLLSELIENAKKIEVPTEIIFHDFSALIHNLGGKEMYRLITYKKTELNKRVNLILFIYPKTHVEHVCEKFRSLAYEIIEVGGERFERGIVDEVHP